MALSPELKAKIDGLVSKNKVLLFMKGNRHFPQCGFSSRLVQLLNEVGPKYETVNVLSDPELREGIKEYSSWPTIPQLYVDGQFVGGCDIVTEMYGSGELHKVLGVEAPKVDPPKIAVTARAAAELKKALGAAEAGELLRFEVSAQFQPELYLGPKEEADFGVDAGHGVTVLVNRASAARANGVSIDFVETKDGGAFKIDNPNEPPRVRAMSAADLKALFDRGERVDVFDVRTPEELAKARLANAVHLDLEGEKKLLALPKDAKVVFMCHHGQRSRIAAERLLKEGWRNVYNLDGGIDAWSRLVDPSVPRY
jgi:monothiol glutaredoxin